MLLQSVQAWLSAYPLLHSAICCAQGGVLVVTMCLSFLPFWVFLKWFSVPCCLEGVHFGLCLLQGEMLCVSIDFGVQVEEGGSRLSLLWHLLWFCLYLLFQQLVNLFRFRNMSCSIFSCCTPKANLIFKGFVMLFWFSLIVCYSKANLKPGQYSTL